MAGSEGGSADDLAVAAFLRRAHEAWPALPVDDAAFLRHVSTRLPEEGDRLAALASADAAGLLLAYACLLPVPGAIESFESTYAPEIHRVLARMGIEVSLRDETVSKLLEHLIFGKDRDSTPLLAAFRGRGALRSWLHSVTANDVLKTLRKDGPLTSVDDLALDLPDDRIGPELAYLRSFYQDEFRKALGRALLTVPKEAANLLRQHHIDKMSLEAVARVHRVHRATAARWLADARAQILARTKEELRESLGLHDSEAESVLSFVKGQSSFGKDLSELGTTLKKE